MIWGWLLGACVDGRLDRLTHDITALEAQVAKMTAETESLYEVLRSIPPPTAAVRMDHDPAGYVADAPLPNGHPRRPDVILLSIDTLRADHLGAYGYHRDTSPFLDSLAADGARFDQAWSPTSWTLPSHTTMLSGQLPVHHGAIDDHLRIADDVPLIQTTFRRGGYRTMAAVATMFVSSRFGFDRDFDQFIDFGIRDKRTNNLSTVDADHVFNHARHWAQKQPDGAPLFLFLHVYDAHYGYDPPAPFNEKFDRAPAWGDAVYKHYGAYKKRMVPAVQLAHQVAQYDEEIAWIDDAFRQFVESWRAAGRDAIVVVTADHGEEFGERGSWGHAHTLWPEQLRVPLIVNGPGIPPAVLTERAGAEDIAPTLAALAGLRFSSLDGVSRAAAIRGDVQEAAPASAKFADTSRFDSLVYRWHDPPWDLHVDVGHGQRSLCNLADDPQCTTNVYRHHGDKAQALFDDMMNWLGHPWTARQTGHVEVLNGILFAGSDRKNQNLDVAPGDRFAVHPGDALVKFTADGNIDGPWRPLGGSVPGARCPVQFSGRFTVGSELERMSDEDRSMLEALGYLQSDEEDEDSDDEPPASGRVACP